MTGDSSVQLGGPPAGLVPGSRVAGEADGVLFSHRVNLGAWAMITMTRS